MSGGEKDTPAKTGGRFVKGKSGNPNGRPRKLEPQDEATVAAFDIITKLTLPMVQDGVEHEVTLQEALTLKTYQDARKGSQLTRKRIIKIIEERDAIRGKQQQKGSSRFRKIPFLIQSTDPDNADAAMLLLDIARHNSARAELLQRQERAQLLLEPWSVQAALSRRRSAVPLTPREVSDIERSTRASTTLKWPRGSRS